MTPAAAARSHALRLPHEIAALVRVGYRRTAAEELAAQRRISFDDALALIDEWRSANGY